MDIKVIRLVSVSAILCSAACVNSHVPLMMKPNDNQQNDDHNPFPSIEESTCHCDTKYLPLLDIVERIEVAPIFR